MAKERIVAVGLLTATDLGQLGNNFQRAYPLEDASCFSDLLKAIDDADREIGREQEAEEQE